VTAVSGPKCRVKNIADEMEVTVERTIGSCGNGAESKGAKGKDGEEFEEHVEG